MFGKTCVKSLLDTDFYKLAMQQAYLHQIPDADAVWELWCRSDEDLTPYVAEMRREFDALTDLYITDDQLFYLQQNFPFLKRDYLAFLKLFRYNPQQMQVSVEGNQLRIRASGPQAHVSPLEIPVLAAISETWNRNRFPDIDERMVRKSTLGKIRELENAGDKIDLSGFKFVDFGTRRRFSFDTQAIVVEMLGKAFPDNFVGTSNPHLAREYQLPCVGTMAHEWLQAHQALNYRLVDSQTMALENWINEYRGELDVALTDTIGIDAFCKDLDRYLAKVYDGFRQDSGDPIVWGEKIISRLEALQIDPTHKTLMFSDGLNFASALKIYQHFHGRINTRFGIGTWLTCHFDTNKPLNIVMKLVELNGQPVAKISDSAGKTQCQDLNFLSYLMKTFAVDPEKRKDVITRLKQR